MRGAPLGDDELPPAVVYAPQQWLVIQINSSDTTIKRSFCFNLIMMILFDGTSPRDEFGGLQFN